MIVLAVSGRGAGVVAAFRRCSLQMKLLGALLGCVGVFANSKKDATEQEQKVAKTGTQLTAEPPASAK